MAGGHGSGTAALREVPLLLAVLFLGTNLLAAVDMAVAGVPPFLFVAAKFSVAGLLLLGIARLLRRVVHPVDWGSTRWGFTLGVAVTAVSGVALLHVGPVWEDLLSVWSLGCEVSAP